MDLGHFAHLDVLFGSDADGEFCDITTSAGAGAPRVPAPAELMPDLNELRSLCVETFREYGRAEFRVKFKGSLFRVAILQQFQDMPLDYLAIETLAARYAATAFDVDTGPSFLTHVRRMLAAQRPATRAPLHITASRVSVERRSVRSLGLTKDVRTLIRSPEARGLILFVGAMSSGKTTSAVSATEDRIEHLKCQALSLEDPIETFLDGTFGGGRCSQVEISRHNPDGYEEEFMIAFRKRIGTIHVTEIRDDQMAAKVLRFAASDHLIISTMHAESIAAAVEFLHDAVSAAGKASAPSLLARSLAAVIHQKLEKQDGVITPVAQCLVFNDPEDREKLKAAIRDRSFDRLTHLQTEQDSRGTYTNARSA